MQVMRVEVVMPVVNVVVITDPEVIMEMHVVISIERIVPHP
tara:strand:- start:16689 stop:16811 length:123 start_codon:yes stop_codon:yes gene_type:complete